MFFKVFLSLNLFVISIASNVYGQTLDTYIPSNDEFPLLFSIEPNAEISTTENIEISPTIVTPEEHKKKAEQFLQKGLYKKSLSHVQELKKSAEHENYAKYIKALVFSQQGFFEESYNILSEIKSFGGDFNDIARNIQAELVLKRAWIELNRNNFPKSQSLLELYSPQKETKSLERKYNHIADALNLQKIKNFSPDTSKMTGQPLKVALLLPLSGVYQNIGQNMLEAAQIALFMYPNPNILLYPHDTQSTQTGARLAAQKAINDRATIILGPLTSEHTRAIQNDTAAAGIPILSFSSDETLANRNTHVFGHQKGIQAVQAAKTIADLDISTTAILAPNTPYGLNMSQKFQDAAFGLGISITQIAYFDPQSTDQSKELKILSQEQLSLKLLTQEKKLLEREYRLVGEDMSDISLTRLDELKKLDPQPLINFKALYLPVSSEKLPLIVSQLAFYDMDSDHVQLIGSGLWHEKSLYRNKGEYIKGAYYPAPHAGQMASLKTEFKQYYNKEMLDISSLAYDAVKLVTMSYSYSHHRPERLTDAFYQEDGYLLSNGPTILNRGGLTQRLYSTYETRRYDFIEKEIAPLAFPPQLPEPLDPRKQKPFESFFNPWGF
jgi:branched-chain amino acid transport system substrate-binding protein